MKALQPKPVEKKRVTNRNSKKNTSLNASNKQEIVMSVSESTPAKINKKRTVNKDTGPSMQLSIELLFEEPVETPLDKVAIKPNKKRKNEVKKIELEPTSELKSPVKATRKRKSKGSDVESQSVHVMDKKVETHVKRKEKKEETVKQTEETEVLPKFIIPYEIGDKVKILPPPLAEMDTAAENYYYRKDYEGKTGVIQQVYDRKKVYYTILIGTAECYFYHHEISLV